MQRALTSGPITGSILLGLCMGSGVAISMQYGSGEYDKMRQSVFQSFALIAGMALADAIGIVKFVNVLYRTMYEYLFSLQIHSQQYPHLCI